MLSVWVRRTVCFCMAVVASFLCAHVVVAQSASVTVGVGDNILAVQGKAPPLAFVTISRDGGVIGTTTADANGAFLHTFPAQDPGIHQISAYATTASGATTDTAVAAVNIAEHATTTVNFFLPPTLILGSSNLAYNESLVVSGEAAPFCNVAIYIDNSNYALVTTNAAGQWSATIATDQLAAGQHSIFARATDEFGEQSYPSALQSFAIANPPFVPVPTTPSPGIGKIVGVGGGVPNVPVIIFPNPGTVWPAPTITVQGSADPGVQIELFDGEQSIGSVWANDRGQWSLELSLQSKDYTLRAKACRGGICSGLTNPITFTAQPPGLPILMVEMHRTLLSAMQHAPVTLQAQIKSGQPPYSIVINWGDGSVSEFTQTHGSLAPLHTYTKVGSYAGWLEVQDQLGSRNRIYFSVLVTTNIMPWLIGLLLLLALVGLAVVIMRKYTLKPDSNDKRRRNIS